MRLKSLIIKVLIKCKIKIVKVEMKITMLMEYTAEINKMEQLSTRPKYNEQKKVQGFSEFKF